MVWKKTLTPFQGIKRRTIFGRTISCFLVIAIITMVNCIFSKGFAIYSMVAAPPPNFRGGGDLKISDQNNYFMVVVLKDILLYLLGFRFIYMVYIS